MNSNTAAKTCECAEWCDGFDRYVDDISFILEAVDDGKPQEKPLLLCSQRLIGKMLEGAKSDELIHRADNAYHTLQLFTVGNKKHDWTNLKNILKNVRMKVNEAVKTGKALSAEDCADINDVMSNAYYTIEQYRSENNIIHCINKEKGCCN